MYNKVTVKGNTQKGGHRYKKDTFFNSSDSAYDLYGGLQ